MMLDEIPSDVLALKPRKAALVSDVSVPTLYNAMNAGELKSFQVGRARLITIDALREWMRSLEAKAKVPKESKAQRRSSRPKTVHPKPTKRAVVRG